MPDHEGDGPEPDFFELDDPPSKEKYWLAVLFTCVIAVGGYLLFLRSSDHADAPPVGAAEAALKDPSLCSLTTSLDGSRVLFLSDNHRASFEDHSPLKEGEDGKGRFVDGEWSYDEASKKYTVTLNGAATTYSLVKISDSNICMLIKGELGAADLRASWFSSGSDDDPGDEEYREPPTPEL
jgi:hypothetical protein